MGMAHGLWQSMAGLPPAYCAELLASSISMTLRTTTFVRAPYIFRLGHDQESELAVGREKQIGHNEDMRGSCMEIESSPPSNPYGVRL